MTNSGVSIRIRIILVVVLIIFIQLIRAGKKLTRIENQLNNLEQQQLIKEEQPRAYFLEHSR